MIAVLRIPGWYAEYRVVLPAAPIPGDIIETNQGKWIVRDRRFVLPLDGEAEVWLRVESAEDSQ